MSDSGDKSTPTFSKKEREAMKARAKELKAEASGQKGAKKAAREEAEVLTKIAEMESPDAALARRVHDTVTAADPDLAPKLWYSQPAYARDGKVVCFFRSGHDDGERYSTFGFTPEANLDEKGGIWATSFALASFDDATERKIAKLVKKARP